MHIIWVQRQKASKTALNKHHSSFIHTVQYLQDLSGTCKRRRKKAATVDTDNNTVTTTNNNNPKN